MHHSVLEARVNIFNKVKSQYTLLIDDNVQMNLSFDDEGKIVNKITSKEMYLTCLVGLSPIDRPTKFETTVNVKLKSFDNNQLIVSYVDFPNTDRWVYYYQDSVDEFVEQTASYCAVLDTIKRLTNDKYTFLQLETKIRESIETIVDDNESSWKNMLETTKHFTDASVGCFPC